MKNRDGASVTHRTKRLSHLDLGGAGQVYVAGDHAYVGYLPNKEGLGTSIVDVSDPSDPKVVVTITLDDRTSHSHKARVVGDVMIVNHERNNRVMGRKAEQLPPIRARLHELLGREPTHAELPPSWDLRKPISRGSRKAIPSLTATAASKSTTFLTRLDRSRSAT